MTPVSEWLRSTRLRQVMPGTEDPWTQDYFLERLEAQSGWHLYRSTYSKYENGRQTPERDTLRKLVAFWATMGEPGPDLTPPATVTPPSDTALIVAAIDRLTAAIERQTGERREWEMELVRAVAEIRTGARPTDEPAGGPREAALR